MPLDPSIILGVRPAQIPQQDPIANYSKLATLKALMGQNQLQDRQIEDDAAVRDAYQQAAGDSKALRSLLGEKGQYKALQTLDKFELDNAEKKGNIEKTKQEVVSKAVAQHRDSLANVNDPQSAAQWVQAGYTDPLLAPILNRGGDVQAALARIPQDPQAFQQWKQQNALGATKYIELNKPHVMTQDTGGSSNVVATPGLGGAPQVLSTTAKTQSPDSVAADARARETLAETKTHHRALEGDPAEIETTAKAISEGRLAPLSGFALARPAAQKIMARVVELNPDFDPTQFQTRQKAEKDFATGKQGNSVRSFNVAISHLSTLDQLADALNNKDTQIINRVGNMVATQTGNAAPTNFEAAKKIVADEIVKAIVGSGGGVQDREDAAKTIQAASSPAQLKGVINTYKELMKGQLHGLRGQYESTTGKKDFDDKFLSPEARAVDKSAPKDKQPAKPQVAADGTNFDSLPNASQYSGRRVRAPDGGIYRSDGVKWSLER
jgi:hypothetical protein